MSGYIVGLGEALVRLSTLVGQPLAASRSFTADIAGAELNALVAAASMGARTRWLTSLPPSPLGEMMQRHAHAHGVDVVATSASEGRAGLFFVEQSVPPRPTRVFYDRLGSSASELQPEDVDWQVALANADVLHVSGVTPALGPGIRGTAKEAIRRAAEDGVRVSFDVNYRNKLWTKSAASTFMRDILPRVDVLVASPHDLVEILGVSAVPHAAWSALAATGPGRELVLLCPKRERIQGTIEQRVSAVARGEVFESDVYQASVIDPFGAGDALIGTFLAACQEGQDIAVATEWAARAAALKHTVSGDVMDIERAQVETMRGVSIER